MMSPLFSSVGDTMVGGAEEVKKAQEEAAKKIEDAKQAKIDAEQRKVQETQAALSVRKVLQKVRNATPADFEEIKNELETVLALELENCGAQKVLVKMECEKFMAQTTERIGKINQARMAQQEKRNAVLKI